MSSSDWTALKLFLWSLSVFFTFCFTCLSWFNGCLLKGKLADEYCDHVSLATWNNRRCVRFFFCFLLMPLPMSPFQRNNIKASVHFCIWCLCSLGLKLGLFALLLIELLLVDRIMWLPKFSRHTETSPTVAESLTMIGWRDSQTRASFRSVHAFFREELRWTDH